MKQTKFLGESRPNSRSMCRHKSSVPRICEDDDDTTSAVPLENNKTAGYVLFAYIYVCVFKVVGVINTPHLTARFT